VVANEGDKRAGDGAQLVIRTGQSVNAKRGDF
jgi:hypothetical protein